MKALRHLLLVVLLFAAQLAAGAHAVEHGSKEMQGQSLHACELCLLAHDLGTALPVLPATLPLVVASGFVAVLLAAGRFALPAPPASQRAPPAA